MGFTKFDERIMEHVVAVQKRISEGKMLGIRVKWHKTGAIWVQQLSERATFAVAL